MGKGVKRVERDEFGGSMLLRLGLEHRATKHCTTFIALTSYYNSVENAKSFLLCGFLWRDMARIAYRNRWSPRPDSPIDTIPPAQPAVRWWIEPKDFQATWQSQSCQGTGCYKFLIFHAHQIYPWFLDVSKSIPASIPHTESLQPRPTSNRLGQFNQSPTCDEGLFSQIQSNVGAGGHRLRKPERFQLSQLTRMGCLDGPRCCFMAMACNGVKP